MQGFQPETSRDGRKPARWTEHPGSRKGALFSCWIETSGLARLDAVPQPIAEAGRWVIELGHCASLNRLHTFPVCRRGFLHTHGLSRRHVRSVLLSYFSALTAASSIFPGRFGGGKRGVTTRFAVPWCTMPSWDYHLPFRGRAATLGHIRRCVRERDTDNLIWLVQVIDAYLH